MIRALIFDFDGLILDTETTDYASWQEVFEAHACNLPYDLWLQGVGASSLVFDPTHFLEQQLGIPIDRDRIKAERKQRWTELSESKSAQPGITDYLRTARAMSFKIGIASNAAASWVTHHLSRLGLLGYFDCIRTGEQVGRFKPEPDVYLSALEIMDVLPQESLAFEDSPHGMMAAKQAGIITIGVPNPATRHLDLSQADLVLDSLADMPLAKLLARFNGKEPD